MAFSPSSSQALSLEQAYSRLAALCSRGEHSSAYVRQRAAQWQLSPADTCSLVERLIDERYIDDARFCRAYTLDKLRYNHWGRIKIRQMLLAQGLDTGHIAQGLEAIDEAEYHLVLAQVIAAKARSLRHDAPRERYAKIVRHAASHGFESHHILRLLEAECDED